ncbi:MAG: RNA-metabolising metallo-beta-lactamase [Candidatus Adlerbacteria bacterium GW2011_GWA1_54_10]|uniref:Ribonuclease J n=2 Tax=Candidatus Adleribacteriota TaxID=1752736 RepID=A0A0G2AS00_9BACT|nr:MAG: RNA-metabolising metallo-beta-lactamase [Candidatus Adlerbacteria bacterium GW2011_GWA1_54_10]KKW37700.1 MAG: RNA-metabolising metallo-beta-lactamase [Candidatus Adlerbacteria bacterium GW2011_GWB1_54_7]
MPTERHRYAANRNAKPRSRALRRGGPRPHQPHPPRTLPEFASQNGEEKPIPPLEAGNIRIVPLGGVEEIGRNMTAIEMGDDIIVVDCGLQFREEDTPGIDYILPNTKYLEDRREKIRGIFVTHGHLDHIGGIPYIIDRLGYPPIYTRQLTAVMIKKRQEEFPHLKPLDIHEVEKEKSIRAGKTKVRFFSVTHTIPDSMGIIVETPYGLIVHTGDLRLEHENGIPSEKEEGEFAIFKKESVLLLMADSTNCEKPGFSIPERVVQKNLDEIITEAKGRLIIGTFSSQLERIMRMLEAAENCGKKVLVEGRSMKVNVEIVKRLGMLKVREKTFIGPEELAGLPDNKVVILATGAQGDEFAALMRIAMKTHKYVQIKKGDTIVLSSSIVPGNERAVQKLKDNLSRQGAKIIHRDTMDVHASGHANRDETFWIHQKINPRFFIPMHGYHYMLRVHADIAKACGRAEEEVVVPDNGAVIEIRDEGQRIVRLKENAPSGLRLVDGFSVGDIQEVVIRDRNVLAQEGMFVIIATVNPRNGRLRKSPDIISRGFVYLRESQDLLQQARLLIKKTIEDSARGQQPVNFDFVKNNVTDTISRFLFEKTNKRPIVIPVILGV